MGRCPQCGSLVPDEAGFCPMDGAALPRRVTTVEADRFEDDSDANVDVEELRATLVDGRFKRQAPEPEEHEPEEHEPEEHDLEDRWVGTVLDRRYRLDERIGSGGMAFVYRATHTLIGRTLAIKILRPELARSPSVVERFLREARCASAVKHPNVVELSDYGQLPEGGAFYVMEFLRGRTLAQRIDEDGPLPPAEALEVALQVCCGLEAIHAENIVHRDLKAENVFLAQRAGAARPVAKVLDFGIARSSATRLTAVGAILGTPEYMSPEQALGQDVDRRTDLYSLGIIMFEMLTGLVPFASSDVATTLHSQIHDKAPLLRSVRPERTSMLVETERVVASLLAKDREQRPPSSTDARLALQHALASDLGADAAARVRATLAIGSGGIAEVRAPERVGDPGALREAPMDWGHTDRDGVPTTHAELSQPVARVEGSRSSQLRGRKRRSIPLVLGTAAAFSAVGVLVTYGVATQLRTPESQAAEPPKARGASVSPPRSPRLDGAHPDDTATPRTTVPSSPSEPPTVAAHSDDRASPSETRVPLTRVESKAEPVRTHDGKPTTTRRRKTTTVGASDLPTDPVEADGPHDDSRSHAPKDAEQGVKRRETTKEPGDLRDPFGGPSGLDGP